MSETLLSVGLDVGTTSTQLIVSELTVENRASGFAVPELKITDRQVRYRSPVYFTPLEAESRVDGEALRELVAAEYEKAGITRETVDTGAVIVTGETSRKENARRVVQALSEFAGEFVVATAGPDLESVLAAKGAGAVGYSADTGKTVLHMDIGGGTANLALAENGEIKQTGCLNVGGRLLKFAQDGTLTYLSPVLEKLCKLKPGDRPGIEEVERIAERLTAALEMAAGLRAPTELLAELTTREALAPWRIPQTRPVLSFSGGVADCIETVHPPFAFGDMGPVLGQAIKKSALCSGAYRLGEETIRATVIGAGCHSARLSGSTVYHRNIRFPLKNLPVVKISHEQQEKGDFSPFFGKITDMDAVLALPGISAPAYAQVQSLARAIAEAAGDRAVMVCLEADMAKALGHALALYLPKETPILCIDGVRLTSDSYLDVGAPIGPAIPIVVKTMILSH